MSSPGAEQHGSGDLARPPAQRVEPGSPPWRDNAFLGFWSDDGEVAGVVHVSTSPNAEGRRARASLSVGGRVVELVEPLEPGSLSSRSIRVDLDAGKVAVAAEGIELDVESRLRFSPADYTSLDVIPAYPGAERLGHVQQGADVAGRAAVDGTAREFTGRAFRDRTWGVRDEAVMFVEYLGVAACFDEFDVSALKFLDAAGGSTVAGFLLGPTTRRVVAATLTRDPRALLDLLALELDDGDCVELRVRRRFAGFWLPVGEARQGPSLSAYDEFLVLGDGRGRSGAGLVEHGVVRRLW